MTYFNISCHALSSKSLQTTYIPICYILFELPYFKVPIWFKFDHQLGKQEYLDIIKKIEEYGFHVSASSCDMAKSNQSLAKVWIL